MPTLGKPIAVGRTAEIFAWNDGHILKLYRQDFPRDWVDYEAKVGRIVCDAGLAAPAIGDIIEIDGRRGIIYERINGISMLASMKAKLWTAPDCARILAELQAKMHACAVPANLSSQRDGFALSVRTAPNLPTELRDAVLQKLDTMPDGSQLCHGDFHMDNVMLTAHGPIVIDWMTAKRGNPIADVARTLLILTIGEPPSPIEKVLVKLVRRVLIPTYLKRYFELRPNDKSELETWLAIVAAARMNEQIPGEEKPLLAIIQEGLQ